MEIQRSVYSGIGVLLMVVAACEAPQSQQKALPAPKATAATAADSTKEHLGCYFETPCYQLVPSDGTPAGPLGRVKSTHYRGRIWMRMQADTARKQLVNVKLAFALLTDKQTGQEVRWYPDNGTPAPADLVQLLPELRQRVWAARLQIVVSKAPDCVMPTNWTLAIGIE